jgi:ureidoglycolate lyase
VSAVKLQAQALTREAFAPFGDVIEAAGAESFAINQGTTERFHDLAGIDVVLGGDRTLVNIFRGQPRSFPFAVTMMERHPLGSQTFVPLDRRRYLVVVAAPDTDPTAQDLRAFLAGGDQGVNYHRGVWHHPLLVLDQVSDFLVIDRGGTGDNLDEVFFEADEGAVLDF